MHDTGPLGFRCTVRACVPVNSFALPPLLKYSKIITTTTEQQQQQNSAYSIMHFHHAFYRTVLPLVLQVLPLVLQVCKNKETSFSGEQTCFYHTNKKVTQSKFHYYKHSRHDYIVMQSCQAQEITVLPIIGPLLESFVLVDTDQQFLIYQVPA